MSQPYIGEIRMFAGNFAPVGWALCQGQLISINENPTLFQLIGTTYGGDGQNTFALPNLQSRVPIHVGPGFSLGQPGGVESVTLTVSQIPAHSHVQQANNTPNNKGPNSNVFAGGSSGPAWFATGVGNMQMNATIVQNTGNSQPHDNMIPFLVINFIISLFGIFPSQN